MSNVPRIRSIRDTEKMFKEMDPNTEITEYTLRKMIAEGIIPVLKTEKKYLINVDLLIKNVLRRKYGGEIMLKTYLRRGGGKLVNSV